MAGEARTSSFLLGSATVMIGPQASLYQLNPDMHSLGLTKNFQVTAEPNYLPLMQGVKSTVVYEVLTGNPVKAQCEVFEYTSKNIAYSLGLGATTVSSPHSTWALLTPIVGTMAPGVSSLTFSDPTLTDVVVPAGTWMSVQDTYEADHVHYFRITADSIQAGAAVTVQVDPEMAFELGNSFPAGSLVSIVNSFDVGSKVDQPYSALMVTGILPEQTKPVSLLFPKVRITRGFSLTFGETAYGNLPFQFTPFELLPTDMFYADFRPPLGNGYGKVFSRT